VSGWPSFQAYRSAPVQLHLRVWTLMWVKKGGRGCCTRRGTGSASCRA
jgi:hypothetical protein